MPGAPQAAGELGSAAGLLAYAVRMNISPHHQRTSKYPWPGRPSIVGVAVVIVVVLVIGLIVLNVMNDDDERAGAGMRLATSQVMTS